MASLKVKLGILAAGLMLSGCMQATTYEATNTNNFKPRDKELLAKTTYAKVAVAESRGREVHLRVIAQVEVLGPELQVHALA